MAGNCSRGCITNALVRTGTDVMYARMQEIATWVKILSRVFRLTAPYMKTSLFMP